MSTIAESASSPAPAVGNSNKRPLETKADAANTGEQKTKQRSVLGGLQGKQVHAGPSAHVQDITVSRGLWLGGCSYCAPRTTHPLTAAPGPCFVAALEDGEDPPRRGQEA